MNNLKKEIITDHNLRRSRNTNKSKLCTSLLNLSGRVRYDINNLENYYSNLTDVCCGDVCTHLELLSDINKYKDFCVKLDISFAFNTDGIHEDDLDISLFFHVEHMKRIARKLMNIKNLSIGLRLNFYEKCYENDVYHSFIESVRDYFSSLFIRFEDYDIDISYNKRIFNFEHLNSFIYKLDKDLKENYTPLDFFSDIKLDIHRTMYKTMPHIHIKYTMDIKNIMYVSDLEKINDHFKKISIINKYKYSYFNLYFNFKFDFEFNEDNSVWIYLNPFLEIIETIKYLKYNDNILLNITIICHEEYKHNKILKRFLKLFSYFKYECCCLYINII